MPSPDLNTLEMDIQLQQNLRTKLSTIDRVRDEFLREVDKIRVEKECVRDFKSLLDDLNTEKLALVNELRNINTDMNVLEQALKQAETSRQKSIENAQRMYKNELLTLRGEIDEIRDAMGKERLPSNLVDGCDLEEIFQRDHNPVSQEPQFDQSTLPTIWPHLTLAYRQNMYAQHLDNFRRSSMFDIMAPIIAAMGNIQNPTPTAPPDETAVQNAPRPSAERSPSISVTALDNPNGSTGGAGFGQIDPMGAAFSAISKQQQPPMKTCTSCQQQIHRNAPICPLCKSKSKSRHPKKKQRSTKADDQQE